jgi:protein SCO1/2
MHRRSFLQTTAAAGAAAGLAGCSGVLGGDGNPNVALSKPDDQPADSEDLPYPAWGQRVPDVTVPAPIADREVAVRDVDTASFVTFFYTNCMTVCPVVVSTLRDVQVHAVENDYADAVTFLPISFDPERDTEQALREYAKTRNVVRDAGNWHFLRPDGVDRAKAVVTEAFGVNFQRTEPQDGEGKYMFNHTALTLLVNADGYVERAYRTQDPDEATLIDDLESVR